ncbi:MAG: hypothetical protein O3A63_05535 [Proteobacteria bacterium]|nr:hypothetical protein [Pseudomonadota bacterium]
MNAWSALFKREWLEHRQAYLLAPLILLGVVVLFLATSLSLGSTGVRVSSTTQSDGQTSNFEHIGSLSDLLALSLEGRQLSEPELTQLLDQITSAVALPFNYLFLVILVFVLTGSLFEDRRDRTVLFWKSLPVSDLKSVLSKLIHGMWIAPLVTIAAIVVAQIAVLLMVTSHLGDNPTTSASNVWLNSNLVFSTLELMGCYVIAGLWSLPLYSWILLVSATVRQLPLVWVLLTPLLLIYVESIVVGTSYLKTGIMTHLPIHVLPRAASSDTAGRDFGSVLDLFTTPDMWIGLLVGAALLYAAVEIRRRNNEI